MSSAPGFDYPALLGLLGAAAARFDVDHLPECDSTNSELLRRAANGAPSGLVVICDRQHAGRGRRGRHWLSAPGDSLTFSVLWRRPERQDLSGLSLVVGLAVAQALEALDITGIGLKWPNDIWRENAKLGGILIETASGGESLVIGIGLNLRENPAWTHDAGRAVTSIEASGHLITREAVLASVLQRLAAALDQFSGLGFPPFREDWNRRDAFAGKPVELSGDCERIEGLCRGVGDEGALRLETPSGLISFNAGDLSLRIRTETH